MPEFVYSPASVKDFYVKFNKYPAIDIMADDGLES